MRTIIKGSEGDKMENVLNYVRLRQDISFQMSPFNVIDALILSYLAYVDWNNIVKDEKVDLQRACRQYFKMHTPEEMQRKYVFSNNVPNLAKEVSRSNRFKDISLMKYREVFDEEVSWGLSGLSDGAFPCGMRRACPGGICAAGACPGRIYAGGISVAGNYAGTAASATGRRNADAYQRNGKRFHRRV